MVIVRLNNLLEKDQDGFVPIADLAKAMGKSVPGMIKKLNNYIRKGHVLSAECFFRARRPRNK